MWNETVPRLGTKRQVPAGQNFVDGDGPARGGTERALVVLKELAQHPSGIALDDLSRRIGAPKSSVHRALAMLIKADLAFRPAAGRCLGAHSLRASAPIRRRS